MQSGAKHCSSTSCCHHIYVVAHNALYIVCAYHLPRIMWVVVFVSCSVVRNTADDMWVVVVVSSSVVRNTAATHHAANTL